MFPLGYAQKRLRTHHDRTEQDDTANGKGDVRISLRPFHQYGKTDLSKVGRYETNDEANRCVLWIEQSKDKEGSRRRETREENHARG